MSNPQTDRSVKGTEAMTHKKRYTAEEMLSEADYVERLSRRPINGYGGLGKVANIIRQSAHTESQVAGLVEYLEAIAESWDSDGRIPLDECEYMAGRRQVGERVAEEIREALSKFRGEA